MRNLIVSLTLCTLLPLAAAAAETKVLSLSGSVEARLTREGEWAPAAANMEIPEGGAVRTSADGAAVLLMPNKTKVWLKETSTLELEQRQTLASRLSLLYGKIKIRVPHLLRKEKFEVRTPAAVCAVRGTEFTMGTTEDGKMDLQVLFGEVKLKYLVPPEKGRSEFSIPQGQGLSIEEKGKSTKPALLNAAVERQALENWNPGLTQEQRVADMKQKDSDRAQVREFARVTNNAEASVKSFVNVTRESDIEAGRTLKDIHGNTVRVDQRMLRPDSNTIQFINLVKRPVYADYTKTAIGGVAANKGFLYNGGVVTNRLDLMQDSIRFNAALPQRLEEWPAFFNDNDDVRPDYISMIMANRSDAGEIFVVAEGLRYDPTRDELVDNLTLLAPNRTYANGSAHDRYVMLTGMMRDDNTTAGINEAQDMLNALSRLEVRDTIIEGGATSVGNMGTLQYKNSAGNWEAMNNVGPAGNKTQMVWGMTLPAGPNGASTWENAGDDTDSLWQFQADGYAIGNKAITGAADYFFLTRENYAINNNGGLLNADDITGSSQDPFSLMGSLAGQTLAYVKQSNGLYSSGWTSEDQIRLDVSDTDKFSYAAGAYVGKSPNIDIVLIPDLFTAALQRVLPALTASGE